MQLAQRLRINSLQESSLYNFILAEQKNIGGPPRSSKDGFSKPCAVVDCIEDGESSGIVNDENVNVAWITFGTGGSKQPHLNSRLSADAYVRQ